MRPKQSFHKIVFPGGLALGLMAVLGAGAVQAQTLQTATPMMLPTGACGQSLGLTHIFALPVDQSPPSAPVLTMARHEPLFVEFRVASTAALRFETSYPDGANADPYLTLFDTAGNVLDSNDDGAGNLNALIEMSVPPGTYCAQVRMLGSPPQGPVDVTLDFRVNGAGGGIAQIGDVFAGDPSLPCGDPARTQIAGRLAPGFGSLGFDGSVPAGSSLDWVIALSQPLSLRIEASDVKLDTVLSLRDSQRTVIAENDDGPNMGTNSMIVETLQPGEYCISVEGYAGTGGNAMLDIHEAAAESEAGQIDGGTGGQVEGGGTEGGVAGGGGFAASGPCGDPARTLLLGRVGRGFGSVLASGTVPQDGAQDWILSLADRMELRLEATSDSLDTVLALHDTAGTLLEENDDGMDRGTDSRIVRTLAAGDYCLSLRGYGGAGGNAQLAAYEENAGGGPVAGGGLGAFAPGQPCGAPETTAYLGTLGNGFLQTYAQGNVPANDTSHFAADLNSALMITVTATSTAFDTVLSVYDAAGALLAENDDGPEMGTDSQVAIDLPAGPVCFAVRGFGGSAGLFELAVFEDDAPGDEPGNVQGGGMIGDAENSPALAEALGPCGDPAVTTDIGNLRAGFGTMSYPLRVAPDGFSNVLFTVVDIPNIRIETTQTSFDTILSLYEGPSLMDENDDSPEGGTDSLMTISLSPGAYCASVRGFAGAGGTLSLVLSEPGQGGAGGGASGVRDAGLNMPDAGSGVMIADLGVLGGAGLSQNEFSAQGETWAAFELAAPAAVTVRAINLTGPFRLGVFEAASGDTVGVASGRGGMVPEVIDVDLPAGRFAIGVAPDSLFDAGLRRIEVVLQ